MTDSAPPVFVFGALRSGTTLFRLMLNAHPGISNPGETDFLFDFLHPDPGHPTGWRYDREAMAAHRIFRARGLTLPEDGRDGLDLLAALIEQLRAKAPGVLTLNVHRNARKIRQTLPGARFIHLLRDPRDVARSAIGMGWTGNSYYGVIPWLDAEADWEQVAADLPADQLLTLQFETLMAEIEPQLTRVCAFLGVAFLPGMLDYHLNTSYGPPDPNIARQWQQKASRHEIALIEGRIGPLLAARGYAPAGQPAIPGAAERLWLALQNRVLRWRHNIRRFGLGLFLSAHLTRLPGLGRLNRRLNRQMEQKIVKALK